MELCSSLLDVGARLRDRGTADARVEIVGGLHQRRRRQPLRQRDDAVLDRLVLADQHDERLAGLQQDELDVLEAGNLLLGQHDAGAVRQAGDHLAGFVQHLVDGARAPAGDVRLDLAALLGGEVADLQKPVDEQAQARVGSAAAPPRCAARR